MFRSLSIKRKLTWITMFTSGIAVLLACVAFLIYDSILFREAMIQDLNILASVIGSNSTAALVFDHDQDAQETLFALSAEARIVRAVIYRADGSPFVRYHRDGLDFSPPEPQGRTSFFTEDHLDLFRPIVLDGEDTGTVYLRSDLHEMRDRQVRYVFAVVVFLLGSFLVVFLITSRLQGIISGPILRLARAARSVSDHKDYSVRAVRDTEDEVGFLVSAFNDMLSQIQQRDAALQEANDELETRVQARTRDLLAANEQLRQEVAERRRTEAVLQERDEQLRQAQKLEAVGRLAGGVAHDFNNQLAIIQGYMEMALEDLPETSRAYYDLLQVGEAVQRSTALAEQLLVFSSRQPMSKRPLNLNNQVRNLQKMLGRILGENIKIGLGLDKDIWTVSADAGNIDQVITNLSLNARDAMPDGGALTIQTRNVVIDPDYCDLVPEAKQGRYILLSVSDEGVGMSKEVREHLFDPFFTTKGPGKGTGLGLSVVYGIVQAHEGWITVESQENRGSRFDIHLPAVAQSAEILDTDYKPVPLAAFRGQGERILLVEDELSLRQVTQRALAGQGYAVEACSTAAEAAETFHRADPPFDLVLSDVALPDGRGTDLVLGFLRKQPDLPAILVTGYADERGDWERVHQAGLFILQKPVPMASLLKAVQKTLSKHAGV